jgi:hypothetical protein
MNLDWGFRGSRADHVDDALCLRINFPWSQPPTGGRESRGADAAEAETAARKASVIGIRHSSLLNCLDR